MDADDYEVLPTASTKVQMVGGAIAGIMEHCVVYPLDSVKTRLQSLSPVPAAQYRGVTDALWRMVRSEGVLRPVRGMSAVVAGAGPAHALYFASYENLRDAVQRARLVPHTLAPGLAGVVATLLHDAIMTPADVVKQRMQMYNSPFRSAFQCALSVHRREGVGAFYRSYTTQLTMNVPFQCTHFVLYELMQNLTNPERRYWPGAHMLSGAVAGAGAAALTTPLDVCKTLLNTQEAGVVTAGRGGGAVSGLGAAVRCVYRHSGPAGFLRGLRARVIYQIPSTAICWTVYETMKHVLVGVGAAEVAPPAGRTHHQRSADLSQRLAPTVAAAPGTVNPTAPPAL